MNSGQDEIGFLDMNIVINTYERTTLWPSVNSHRAEIAQITKKIPFKFEKEKWVEI